MGIFQSFLTEILCLFRSAFGVSFVISPIFGKDSRDVIVKFFFVHYTFVFSIITCSVLRILIYEPIRAVGKIERHHSFIFRMSRIQVLVLNKVCVVLFSPSRKILQLDLKLGDYRSLSSDAKCFELPTASLVKQKQTGRVKFKVELLISHLLFLVLSFEDLGLNVAQFYFS